MCVQLGGDGRVRVCTMCFRHLQSHLVIPRWGLCAPLCLSQLSLKAYSFVGKWQCDCAVSCQRPEYPGGGEHLGCLWARVLVDLCVHLPVDNPRLLSAVSHG